MRDIKKVIIAGGTGFLGYPSAEEFLKKGIDVDIIALNGEMKNLDFVDKRINIITCDLFSASEQEIAKIFINKNYDALIYALGPDDRVTPPAPAYDFFHSKLVDGSYKVVSIAKECGIKHATILSSYFAHFNRVYNGKLAKYHPYIKCRAEQQAKLLSLASDHFSVNFLELPYIFGIAEGRTPIWKSSFLSHFDGFKKVFFPRGGSTAIISRDGVAEAVVACTIAGENKKCYPIATDNISFKELLSLMLSGMGDKRKIIMVPAFLCALGTHKMVKANKKSGKEPGLYYPKVMTQILSKKFEIDPEESMKNLKFDAFNYKGGKNAREEVVRTMEFFK